MLDLPDKDHRSMVTGLQDVSEEITGPKMKYWVSKTVAESPSHGLVLAQDREPSEKSTPSPRQ
jgi:hypothetical protein